MYIEIECPCRLRFVSDKTHVPEIRPDLHRLHNIRNITIICKLHAITRTRPFLAEIKPIVLAYFRVSNGSLLLMPICSDVVKVDVRLKT